MRPNTDMVIVVFQMPPGTPQSVANRFTQKFYGQETTKAGGKYHYRKVGLLDAIPHRKLRRGVVMLWARDEKAVQAFLKEWGVLVEVRVIRPVTTDLKTLRSGAREA